MQNKKYHIVGTIPKCNSKILEKEEDLLKLQNDSIHTQPVAETNSETIADVLES
jgi:hypothetical protein